MLNIVIAEDEEMIRRGLVETIDWAAMGAAVVGEAADGAAALDVVRRVQPDVLLADIRMPRLSGLALAERLHAAGSPVAIVFLTSYADFSYAQQAVRLGAADYLLKPVDEAELAGALASIAAAKARSAGTAAAEPAAGAGHAAPADEAEGRTRSVLVDWTWDAANPYVADVLAAIRTRYRERLGIEELAAAAGVSASYLSRKLKEATGHTFVSLLARRRLAESLPLLRAGRLRVYEVAEAVGFSDYKNFSQVFKKYLHESPKSWLAQEEQRP